jgi:hypothetical protein
VIACKYLKKLEYSIISIIRSKSMQTLLFKYLLTVLGLAFCLTSTATAGDLEPPAAPAPTMKTLGEVEPRIPVGPDTALGDEYYEYIIRSSGSYYLTGNINTAKGGINIICDDVTIDLCGFALKGGNTGYGIQMEGLRNNIEIRNGTIRNFTYGITQTSPSSNNSRIIDVTVSFNTERGISLIGQTCEVRNCAVSENAASSSSYYAYGISVGGNAKITGNKVSFNANGSTSVQVRLIAAGVGSIITDNVIHNNASFANLSEAYNSMSCISAGAGSRISGNVIQGNANGLNCNAFQAIVTIGSCNIIANTIYGNGTEATGTFQGIAPGDYSLVDHNTLYYNKGINMINNLTCTYGLNVAP